jgi:hypothetical protein
VSADQAWIDGVASDPSRVGGYGFVAVSPVVTAGANANPRPASSGRTADGAGWTFDLNSIQYPTWNQTAYGMNVNVWLACVSVSS